MGRLSLPCLLLTSRQWYNTWIVSRILWRFQKIINIQGVVFEIKKLVLNHLSASSFTLTPIRNGIHMHVAYLFIFYICPMLSKCWRGSVRFKISLVYVVGMFQISAFIPVILLLFWGGISYFYMKFTLLLRFRIGCVYFNAFYIFTHYFADSDPKLLENNDKLINVMNNVINILCYKVPLKINQ